LQLVASFVADSITNSGSSRRIVIGCQIGIALGLALTVAGGLWNALARPDAAWSEKQAAEFKSARNALHDMTYNRAEDQRSDGSPGEPSKAQIAERAAAKARFDRIEAELAAARVGYHRTGMWLVRLGLAAMIVFGVGYFASHGP
jgi:hypothetical protein